MRDQQCTRSSERTRRKGVSNVKGDPWSQTTLTQQFPWPVKNNKLCTVLTAYLFHAERSAVIIMSMSGMSERQLTNSKSPSLKGRCILTGFSLAWAPPAIIDGWTEAAAAAAATGAVSWLGAAITVLAITPTVEPIPFEEKETLLFF